MSLTDTGAVDAGYISARLDVSIIGPSRTKFCD